MSVKDQEGTPVNSEQELDRRQMLERVGKMALGGAAMTVLLLTSEKAKASGGSGLGPF
jgi:hypothetical protein